MSVAPLVCHTHPAELEAVVSREVEFVRAKRGTLVRVETEQVAGVVPHGQ